MNTDDYDDEQGQEQDRNWRRDLERRAREGDEAKKQVAELQRQLAFRDAGLDLTKPGVGYFVKGYEGELDPEKIKAAAVEAGFLSDEPPAPAPAEDHPAQAVLEQIGEAAAAPSEGGVDVESEMRKAYEAGGMEAMLDVVQKHGVPVTTRQ